jgi:hypothetical protein
MDQVTRQMLPYQRGYLALTSTHLLVVRNEYLAESFALKHVSAVATDEAHSFRHRVLGLIAGLILLAPPLALLLTDNAVGGLARLVFFWRGRFAFGVLFLGLFGLLFLWQVLASRRIWWLHLRYGRVPKSVPLPGVDPESLEGFVKALGGQINGNA